VFVKFLTRNTRVLEQQGFDAQLRQAMHRGLRAIARRSGGVLRAVDEAFDGNAVVATRLKQLLKSEKLPEF
jgi:hypothetical protein